MQTKRMDFWTPWGRRGWDELRGASQWEPAIKHGELSSVKNERWDGVGWEGGSRRRVYMYTYSWFMGFPCGSAGKESTCNAGDLDSIPGLGRSPGEGKGYPLQDSGLENSMDCIVHGGHRVRHDWATFTFTAGSRCCAAETNRTL